MINSSTPPHEASKNDARDGIRALQILKREGARLPPLRAETARWVKHRLAAPHHGSGLKALAMRWAMARHMALEEGHSSFVHGADTLVWWTGLFESGTNHVLVIVYDLDEDQRLHSGRHRLKQAVHTRDPPSARPLPANSPFAMTRHGLQQGLDRGSHLLPKPAAADNLRNKIEQLQEQQRIVPWTLYVDSERCVVRQWLVQDATNGVVAIREGVGGILYNATTLTGAMARSQQWLLKHSLGPVSWRDEGTSPEGAEA
jgi:hypothetical protein